MVNPTHPPRLAAVLALCVAVALGGCAQLLGPTSSRESGSPASRRPAERPRPAPAPAPAPAPPPAPAEEPEPEPETNAVIHADGLRLYRAGQYDAAIARFQAVQSPASLRVQALKYTAFSYCVTNRLSDCERAFAQALALSPRFRLTQAEQGHPVWGPVFTTAVKARGGRR
ncbi:MAG: TssQ family T6SS-associated lipoprotein [Pseudomonadota bacterium]|nr:TssQ family T6SS-associated lipoprotein [Pseudomonadota bacterium]